MMQSMPRIARRLVLLLLSAAIVAGFMVPGAALAAPNGPTMVITLRAFPSGTVVPSQLNGTVLLSPGSQVNLSAPATAYSPNPYGFAFWNITSDVRTTPSISFTAPTDTSTFYATAWYLPVGGPCPGCPSGTGVTTFAFSMNNDQILSTTPIASVNPSSAWAGPPATFVSTTSSASPVAITALSKIGGSGLFNRWLQFGNGSVAGSVLTVPSSGASFAIAFYGIPVPDPCEGVRTELDYLSPGDFLTLQQYQRARAQLTQQLLACERQYGEI
jgi:hypothetical protein